MKQIFFLIVLFFIENTSAQCAMCKAVISNGNDTMAKSVNSGISYLMVFPYLLVGLLFFFLYRYQKKLKNKIERIKKIM